MYPVGGVKLFRPKVIEKSLSAVLGIKFSVNTIIGRPSRSRDGGS
jgi:hypothetical protein